MKPFLTRLAQDTRGNAMIIAVASIIPMLGVVGGAIDTSRVYIVRTRLQNACDAGALAGRKSMDGNTWVDTDEQTAERFFDTNFTDGKYGSENVTVNYTASSAGAVTGTATASVPMSIMRLFAVQTWNLTVSCTADLQVPNTDVMFVLDTTLSMNDINPGDTLSRIAVLRSSVTSFYDTLEDVRPPDATIRYGFVPYSSTVNVGMLLQRDWIADSWTYDSRRPDGTSTSPGGVQGDTLNNTTSVVTNGTVTTQPWYQGPSEQCTAPPNNLSDTYTQWTAWSPSANALPRSRTRTRTRNGTTYSANLVSGVCRITPTVYNNYTELQTNTVSANPNAGQQGGTQTHYHWIYEPISYSLTALKGTGAGTEPPSGGSFTAVVANNHGNRTITWNATNACIEERATRRTDEGTTVPMHDMNVDLVPTPTDPATQWKPYLPGVVYGRNATSATAGSGWQYSGSPATYTRNINANATTNYYTPFGSGTTFAACPSAARMLSAITSTELTNYLTGLQTAGYTYHDIGMAWGIRLMSRDGLFQAHNRANEVGGRVARHLIFMTDGDTDTRFGAYDAWGLSAVARRRTPTNATPTNATQNALTETRLTELCRIAREDKRITVWVIAFGTTLTPLLENCASPGNAYQADNADELNETFAQIASQIAQLRLTS